MGTSTTTGAAGNGSVIVHVVSADGSQVHRSFDVTITRAGVLYTDHYQSTDQSGMTEFSQLGIAEYQVTASAPGYQEGSATVDVNPSRNPAVVTVTVEPTTDNSSTPAEEKGLTLAPNAKKEAATGISAMGAGHYDEAEQHLLAAYKLAPGNPSVNDMLGELYITTKNYDKAEDYLLRAISLEPDDASAQTDLGYVHLERKEYPAAKTNLERAVVLSPQNWFAHWLLGVSYLKTNQPDKARDEAKIAVKVGKGRAADAQYLLGESLAVLGLKKEAISALEKFVKDSPNNSNAPAANALIASLKSGTPPAIFQPNSGPNDGAVGAAPTSDVPK